jgi:tetratricopeptide (TPR) repeat protein
MGRAPSRAVVDLCVASFGSRILANTTTGFMGARQPPASARPTVPPAPSDATGDRLDSWKEIAQFLKRDVRTVQRWEKFAGLPVHRHAESRLRTAYAYRSELDGWWRAQSESLDAGERSDDHAAAEETPASVATLTGPPAPLAVVTAPVSEGAATLLSPRAWRRPAFVGAVAFVLLAAALASIASYRRPRDAAPAPPALAVLFTGFENQTGDAGISGWLDDALRKELTADDAFGVVPPDRVARLLRLMRRDPQIAMTEVVGREIGARDDGIGLVLSGTVRRVGRTYAVSLRAIDPVDGRLRAGVARQAHDVSDLLATVRDEATQIRARLIRSRSSGSAAEAAASPSRRVRERFEEVTTPSLSALRLYTQAVRAGRRRQWAAAELLARRAVEIDDQFASAYSWIAWAMRNQRRPASECLPIAERAVALSKATSDRELYLIQGTYANIAGDLDRAIAAYEALLRLNPTDARVIELLIDCYTRAGRVVEAVQRAVARASAEPDDFYANVRAAHALAIWHRDRRAAQPFLDRSQRLVSHDVVSERPYWSAWLSLLPAFERWQRDDVQGLLDDLARAERDLDVRVGRERDGLATAVGFSYVAAGKLRRAESVLRTASWPTRQINLAMLSVATGDLARGREWLQQVADQSAERPAIFAVVGMLDEAERGMRQSFDTEHDTAVNEVTRGLILMGRGRPADAIGPLRRGLELLRYTGEPEYFWAAEALSRAWLTLGDRERALRILEDAAGQRPRTYSSARWSGAEWIRAVERLAALCESAHLQADADRWRATLRGVLRLADADHPFVNHASRPQS